MKCPICNGELVQREAGYKISNEKIQYNFFKCGKCREELVFEDAAQKVFDRLAEYKLQIVKRIKLQGAG